jgi:hypothetical protein
MNIDEYKDAEIIVETYKVCSGCNGVFKTEQMHGTWFGKDSMIIAGSSFLLDMKLKYWCDECFWASDPGESKW